MFLFDQSAGSLIQGNGTNSCSAVLAVEGVSPYYSPSTGAIVWRYRSAAMLKEAAHLYGSTVVLSDHPDVLADSYPRDLVVGAVVSAEWSEEERGIVGGLLIHDYPAVAQNGYFSHGVLAECRAEPGIWQGVRYDEVIEITGVNHIASTASPRQGDRVRLLMDSVKGEYAVDPTTLVIALPVEASPEVSLKGEQMVVDATEESLALLRAQLTSVCESLEVLQRDQEGALAEIKSLAERFELISETAVEAREALVEPSSTDILSEALTIQKAALTAGVSAEDLLTEQGRGAIVGAIEQSVGLTDSWDPTGLTLQQRLAVCEAIKGSRPKEPTLPTVVIEDARKAKPRTIGGVSLPFTAPQPTQTGTTLRIL